MCKRPTRAAHGIVLRGEQDGLSGWDRPARQIARQGQAPQAPKASRWAVAVRSAGSTHGRADVGARCKPPMPFRRILAALWNAAIGGEAQVSAARRYQPRPSAHGRAPPWRDGKPTSGGREPARSMASPLRVWLGSHSPQRQPDQVSPQRPCRWHGRGMPRWPPPQGAGFMAPGRARARGERVAKDLVAWRCVVRELAFPIGVSADVGGG